MAAWPMVSLTPGSWRKAGKTVAGSEEIKLLNDAVKSDKPIVIFGGGVMGNYVRKYIRSVGGKAGSSVFKRMD